MRHVEVGYHANTRDLTRPGWGVAPWMFPRSVLFVREGRNLATPIKPWRLTGIFPCRLETDRKPDPRDMPVERSIGCDLSRILET